MPMRINANGRTCGERERERKKKRGSAKLREYVLGSVDCCCRVGDLSRVAWKSRWVHREAVTARMRE